MKNTLTYLCITAFATTVLLFAGCGKTGLIGIDMSNQSDIEHAISQAAKHIGENDLVSQVVFVQKQKSGVTKRAGSMMWYIFRDGSDQVTTFFLPLEMDLGKARDTDTHEEGWGNHNRVSSVAFKDIDFSKVAEYVNKAGQFVADASEQYDEDLRFSGVGGYQIRFTGEPLGAVHNFDIESKDNEESTYNVDTYYSFDFEVRDGELISKDL